MTFSRSSQSRVNRSVRFVRIASTVCLLAYPAGALTLALGSDTFGTSLVGYGLILCSLICVALLAGSSTQRIVAEEARLLDEYEIKLRYRAMSTAYTLLTVLALCAIIYAAVASDKGGWVPRSAEAYDGVFWGVFLYGFTLPTATLAWQLDPFTELAA